MQFAVSKALDSRRTSFQHDKFVQLCMTLDTRAEALHNRACTTSAGHNNPTIRGPRYIKDTSVRNRFNAIPNDPVCQALPNHIASEWSGCGNAPEDLLVHLEGVDNNVFPGIGAHPMPQQVRADRLDFVGLPSNDQEPTPIIRPAVPRVQASHRIFERTSHIHLQGQLSRRNKHHIDVSRPIALQCIEALEAPGQPSVPLDCRHDEVLPDLLEPFRGNRWVDIGTSGGRVTRAGQTTMLATSGGSLRLVAPSRIRRLIVALVDIVRKAGSERCRLLPWKGQ
ncbi:hypothetical protein L226DRAFT_122174 [Lentinus tigrinus ALCF2SS1-7]|uniref:Uncharacterized protein n=1 Tax=Lentinus tigrinus ALCF2SS1-6 TaxID=1328759 RepID=A0A5C2SV19_9APHY|nr:hypothetical protein L227DRAFT_8071 [Lentinus tigrinus ALCF2SS1-6]RPD80843.1 hypothetical protein L226DRAFT_122174 [Lentinus tigrinus ALCF2SS1-7]